MDHGAFDGGQAMMHGPGGVGEFLEEIGAVSGILVLLVLFALLAWGAYRLLPQLGSGARADPAENILRERFARGEVSGEEYESTLEILRSSRSRAEGTWLEPQGGGSPRRSYEDYVREAMKRLRPGRSAGS